MPISGSNMFMELRRLTPYLYGCGQDETHRLSRGNRFLWKHWNSWLLLAGKLSVPATHFLKPRTMKMKDDADR
eukprot:6211181-Lingulodinium_polyedra.AAC.1